jgi:hypothetical protein
MSKITISDASTGYNLSLINDNFAKVSDALNSDVLYRRNPTGEPNEMENDLDMNAHRILNLPAPVADSEPARKKDLVDLVAGNFSLVTSQLIAVAVSVATLRATDATLHPTVLVTGYYQSGDGGGGAYYYDSADKTSADNGGSIIVTSSGCRYKLVNQTEFWVEQFGAKGDGVTDDAPAINAAIAALPARGGTVKLAGKTYGIKSGIVIGNGNNGNTASTKNAVKLIGMGGGASFFAATPTVLQVLDSGQTAPYIDTVLTVNGAIDSVKLADFKIYCLGANSSLANNGVVLKGVCGSHFENVQVTHHKVIGWSIAGGATPTGNYNIFNKFVRVAAVSNQTGNIGLYMNGVASVSNDTWLTTFEGCRFDTMSANNAIAGYFAFVDSVTFTRCHFVANNNAGVPVGTNTYGVYFNAVGNPQFPAGINFEFCSILNTFVNENATDKIRTISFLGYGTFDNETVPTHAKLKGLTDDWVKFNWS